MTLPRLYNDLACLWPLLSPPEDYESEAAAIAQVVKLHCEASRPVLMEMGAGGGHTLSHLADDFDLIAVDLAEPMLINCRVLCPSAQTVVGDMRSLPLSEPVDVVLIHDAVDYMTTMQDVQAALQTAAIHLKPGGLLMVAPTYTLESFEDHQTAQDAHADDEVAVRFASHIYRLSPDATQFIMDMTLLIKENNQLRIERDRHTCGLFSEQAWEEMIEQSGFDLCDPDEALSEMPWHAFVGIKRRS